MKVTEMINNKVFIEATKNKVLTNESGGHFDTIIISKDLMNTIKEIDQPSEYWGMNLEELFPGDTFEKQRDELTRILGVIHDATHKIDNIISEIDEMRLRNER